MDDIKAGIQYVFQTQNDLTLAVSGTGHAGMEAACCNLVEPGDVILVATNGIWGERFADMVDRCGGKSMPLNNPVGVVFSLDQIEEGLRNHKPSVFFITHGESSTGVCQPLEGIGTLCHQYNCILLVDSVAALGGVPMFMDNWEIDVLYTGSQKVISAPSGTAPISFSPRARAKVDSRKHRVQSFYFDINHLANYWGVDGQPRRYHHTCPTSNLYMLREGLARLAEEGLEACWERHRKCAELLYKALANIGVQLFVKDENHRLPTVNTVIIPDGVDWMKVVKYAMEKYFVEIAGGLGPTAGKIGRIGLMGYNATPDNIDRVIKALDEGLKEARQPKSKV
ncbi:alanine--glyoxylate aminotransferase-like isoform X2 [Tubulanus polymorphus]